MAIIIIPHARIRMAKRGIDEIDVVDTISNPEFDLPGKRGRRIAIKRIGIRLLKVVYEDHDQDKLIITTTWTERVS